jgi:hypothetical protein
MSSSRGPGVAAVAAALCFAVPSMASEEVGQAVLIKTAVTGQSGPLAVQEPVHRDERISTSTSGLGLFLFRDGTKLAVGGGSSVVIDKFVFDDSNSVKKLSIKAAKGTFRWISGGSKSSAYQILTPAGTIGVRGTAFDFYVGPDGTTAIVLLSGAAQLCGANGCKQLTRRCDCVIAKPNGSATDARRVNRDIFTTLGNKRALPFLSGAQQLTSAFGSKYGCGISMASNDVPASKAPQGTRHDKAEKADQPDKPDKPDNPGTPGKPDTHDPGKPDSSHDPGKPDTGRDGDDHHDDGHDDDGHHDDGDHHYDGDHHDGDHQDDGDQDDGDHHHGDHHDGDHHDRDHHHDGDHDGGDHDGGDF